MKNKTTTIQVYRIDKDYLDSLSKFRHEGYKDILHRILSKTIKLIESKKGGKIRW